MARKRIFFFDVETTGLGKKGERVVPVQIAGIIVDPNTPGWPEVGRFGPYFLQIPVGAHCEPYAMEMHEKKHRSRDFFRIKGLPPAEVYSALKDFLAPHGKCVPGGHNAAPFDLPILRREAALHGVELEAPRGADWGLDYHVYDTAVQAYQMLHYCGSRPLASVSLKPLCEHLGIPVDEAQQHDAMYDIELTVQCAREMHKRLSHALLKAGV